MTNMDNATKARFVSDVRDLLADGPALLSDLVSALRRGDTPRHRRWRNVPSNPDLEAELEIEGFTRRIRRHGAGVAVYFGIGAFNTITDGRGIVREVY